MRRLFLTIFLVVLSVPFALPAFACGDQACGLASYQSCTAAADRYFLGDENLCRANYQQCITYCNHDQTPGCPEHCSVDQGVCLTDAQTAHCNRLDDCAETYCYVPWFSPEELKTGVPDPS